ncbi:MAG TPA: hypothetical protein PLF73_05525 [Luteimonas sp.]|nr:hypothetical protein [Luteimonas sp.]
MPPQRRPARFAVAAGLLLLTSLGIAAAWVLLAMAVDRQCSWMALVAAADAALVVRLVRMQPGPLRASCGMLATALAIAAANWGLVAAWLGRYMGLLPWESMLKLGPEFAWLLVQQANGAADLAWLAAGLVVAAFACR